MLAPAVGWRIDLGQPGGFFINPLVSFPIAFGSFFGARSRESYIGADGNEHTRYLNNRAHRVRVGIGIGGSF